jgi:hypothetical protein
MPVPASWYQVTLSLYSAAGPACQRWKRGRPDVFPAGMIDTVLTSCS